MHVIPHVVLHPPRCCSFLYAVRHKAEDRAHPEQGREPPKELEKELHYLRCLFRWGDCIGPISAKPFCSLVLSQTLYTRTSHPAMYTKITRWYSCICNTYIVVNEYVYDVFEVPPGQMIPVWRKGPPVRSNVHPENKIRNTLVTCAGLNTSWPMSSNSPTYKYQYVHNFVV